VEGSGEGRVEGEGRREEGGRANLLKPVLCAPSLRSGE
jgi:hypothetical protein